MTAMENLLDLAIHLVGHICSSCRHSAYCGINKRPGKKPVCFCEEFETAPGPPEHGTREHDFVRPVSAEKPLIPETDLADTYVGLCRTCRKLSRCNFSKPGGGTWQCAAYVKGPT